MAEQVTTGETIPLSSGVPVKTSGTAQDEADPSKEGGFRADVWAFLEAQTTAGRIYQYFTVVLILVNVVAFVLGTVYDQQYNVNPATGKFLGPTWPLGDVLFFGVNTSNPCSVLEGFTVVVFTIDYILRFWAVVESEEYNHSRWEYFISFFSIVDLLSILPFYVDLMLPNTNLPACQFMRMFRLFRMMKVEGRYAAAFRLFDDALASNTKLLYTAAFVGAVVWIIFAGFYYVAERENKAMIYCPQCPDVETSSCTINEWGSADCTGAQCSSQCWNLFESIPLSMYFTGVNLFGEFPLTDRQSNPGKVIAVCVAVIAVVIFGIPTGVFGNAFQNMLEEQKNDEEEQPDSAQSYGSTEAAVTAEAEEREENCQTLCYDVLFGNTIAALVFDYIIFFLIITSILAFFFETWSPAESIPLVAGILLGYEILTVVIFTIEYILRLYCCGVNPKYAGWKGRLEYMCTFQSIVDLLSILPFYISLALGGRFGLFFRALRLIRLFKADRFVQAFKSFEYVLLAQMDLLVVGGFVALVFWILFSSLMYFTERTNPDAEIRGYYLTIPGSMWITMLNLSGECPLAYYTPPGMVIQIFIGIFAVGVVGIPIGILGAGFQQYVEDKHEETPDAPPPEEPTEADAAPTFKERVRDFVEGKTVPGRWFQGIIFLLIFATITTTIIGTLPALECQTNPDNGVCSTFSVIEFVAAIIFTLEWLVQVYAAPSALGYIFSFYSLIDIIAVLPFWLGLIFPGSWIARHDQYFIILRILRLWKLDEYIPSITLIDDAFRLKWNQLMVTIMIASILLIIFAALMYTVETNDTAQGIDDMPEQGCTTGCTEATRYNSGFAAFPFTLIHLTGDFPIIEYSPAGRVVCFIMIIIAVGLFAIPAALLADGFVTVLKTKTEEGEADGTWEIERRKLDGPPPVPPINEGWFDELQIQINSLLNGKRRSMNSKVKRTIASTILNTFILILIVVSVVCILVESVPSINQSYGDALEVFEVFTVLVFTIEYALRLFSASKDIEHLYSRWYYATTFFGIVDLLSILPWYIEMIMFAAGYQGSEFAAAFRVIRLFRLFELEHFVVAFTILDNVFRHSRHVLIAASVMAIAIWIGAASLFYIFEYNNPNWCATWTDPKCETDYNSSCVCSQRTYFASIPDSMYITAVFLAGEWACVDFTIPGKLLCMALCLVGIAIYAIPVGTLFEGFGAVLEAGGDLKALDDDDDGD